jgi:hypothetical protein
VGEWDALAGAEIVPTEREDGKRECPECHGVFTVTKAGEIRGHKCDGVRDVSDTGQPKGATRLSRKVAPKNVRKLAVDLISSGVEYGAEVQIAKYVPMERTASLAAAVELPDSDMMVGPIVELVWPTLPKGAQKAIKAIADQSDLIACALLWAEWSQTLRTFAREQRALVLAQQPGGGVDNGQVKRKAQGGTNVSPFTPASP